MFTTVTDLRRNSLLLVHPSPFCPTTRKNHVRPFGSGKFRGPVFYENLETCDVTVPGVILGRDEENTGKSQ